jgi:hypothetical protein
LIQFRLYLDLTSFISEIFGSFLMTSFLILSSLVYPFPLFLKYYNKLLLQYDNKFIKICSPSLGRMCLLNCGQVEPLRRIAGYCNLLNIPWFQHVYGIYKSVALTERILPCTIT